MTDSYFDVGVLTDYFKHLGSKYKERSLNLRAVMAEFVGMMFFVFTGTGTAVSFSSKRKSAFASGSNSGQANVTEVATSAAISAELKALNTDLQSAISINASFGIITALAFGVGIMVVAYCIAHVSGAHLNPAVTASLVLSGNCNIVQGVANVIAQIVGSILASGLLYGITPRSDPPSDLGANAISAGISSGGALGGEIIMTALLCFVVHMTVCTKPNDINPMAPLAIGFAVFMAHAVLIPIDGCSINPARSLGPAIVGTKWTNFWVFVVGPLIGSVFGFLFWVVAGLKWDQGDIFAGKAGADTSSTLAHEDASPAGPQGKDANV